MRKIYTTPNEFESETASEYITFIDPINDRSVRYVKCSNTVRPYPKVKEECKRQGKTIMWLSKKVFISYQMLVNGLLGHVILTETTKDEISEVLGVSREVLFDE